MTQAVYLEHAARKAGYFLPDEEAEQRIRGLAANFSGGETELKNQVGLSAKAMTGGAIFSDSEITMFLEGYSIKDILAVRIADMGDIQIAHGSARSQEPELTPAEKAELEAFEEESVTCRRCGWRGIPDIEKEERVTGYVGLSNGYGGMLARPMKELDFLSICPKCGAKVHDPKFQESLRQAKEEGEGEFWLWMLGTAVVVGLIIFGMIASLPND